MSVLRHSRGDKYLAQKAKTFKNGQFFWEYVNTDRTTSSGHTYSEGQLYIQDPSSTELTEVANRRSLDSLTFRGYVESSTFDGTNFDAAILNTANEATGLNILHCHAGDFFILKTDNDYLNAGDIILITAVTETDTPTGHFRSQVTHADTILLNDSGSSESGGFNYKGTIESLQDLNSAQKKANNMFLIVGTFYVPTSSLTGVSTTDSYYKLNYGDFIAWSKSSSAWLVIPSGEEAADVNFYPDEDAIDSVATFEEYHKNALKLLTNVQDALNTLATTKAQIGTDGKIPLSLLPDLSGLQIQGKFYPVKDTTKDSDTSSNQNAEPTDTNIGAFWIVDCQGCENVQYKKLTGYTNIELNSGDWLVYTSDGWVLVDNSDRISAIQVLDNQGNVATCVSNVTITGKNINVYKSGDNTVVIDGSDLVGLKSGVSSKEGYVPVFADNAGTLINSVLHEDDSNVYSDLGFIIGSEQIDVESISYGDFHIGKTAAATKTTWQNNALIFDSAVTAPVFGTNQIIFRNTNLRPSEKDDFLVDETAIVDIDVSLPDTDSTLVGIMKEDVLDTDYITKTRHDGFITNTLTSENYLDDVEVFTENYENGFVNVGIGRTTSEDVETGEITFYAKTKDISSYSSSARGFYTEVHSTVTGNGSASNASKTEHLLNRNELVKTNLVIHPSVLKDERETLVKMPPVSGTLLVWEQLNDFFGHGVPLMIPAWECKKFSNSYESYEFVGLDTSPITIKTNRTAYDGATTDRENYLGNDYGTNTTWSYKNASENGLSNVTGRRYTDQSRDDVVAIDAWLDVHRAVATKESFILPATGEDTEDEILDTWLLTDTKSSTYTGTTQYSKDSCTGKFQKILPSRTIYKDEYVYFDPGTGKLIPQNVTTKDVEMPPVGGVLLSSRTRIDGGVWLSETDIAETGKGSSKSS